MPEFTAAELRERIRDLRADGERLDKVGYFGRDWVGGYAGNADVLADCLEELLNLGVVSVTPFKTQLVAHA